MNIHRQIDFIHRQQTLADDGAVSGSITHVKLGLVKSFLRAQTSKSICAIPQRIARTRRLRALGQRGQNLAEFI